MDFTSDSRAYSQESSLSKQAKLRTFVLLDCELTLDWLACLPYLES